MAHNVYNLDSDSELEQLTEVHEKISGRRKKMELGSKIIKASIFGYCSQNVLVKASEHVDSLMEIQTYIDAVKKVTEDPFFLQNFLHKEVIAGATGFVSEHLQNDLHHTVAVATAVGAVAFFGYLHKQTNEDSYKTYVQLQHGNTDFYSAMKDKLPPKLQAEYESYTQNLAHDAMRGNITGEGKGQSYKDAKKITDVQLNEVNEIFMSAADIADYVMNGNTEAAQFLKKHCAEQIADFNDIEDYLKIPEVRDYLITHRADFSRTRVFINEYINAIDDMKLDLLTPVSGLSSKSYKDQIHSIKNNMLLKSKELADLHIAMTAFATDIERLNRAFHYDAKPEEIAKYFIEEMKPFVNLHNYKAESETREAYEFISSAAEMLVDDMKETLETGEFTLERFTRCHWENFDIKEKFTAEEYMRNQLINQDPTGSIQPNEEYVNYNYAAATAVMVDLMKHAYMDNDVCFDEEELNNRIEHDLALIDNRLAKTAFAYKNPKIHKVADHCNVAKDKFLGKIAHRIRLDDNNNLGLF